MSNQQEYEIEKQKREAEERAKIRREKTGRIAKLSIIWIIVLAILGLIVWGMVVIVKNYDPQTVTNAVTIDNTILADDWVHGSKNAEVIIYEYADFQCPACAAYSPILDKAVTDFNGKVALVYRYFPLPMHSNAEPMSRAAEAAGRQGKFWEMHDLLFAKQSEWSLIKDPRSKILEYAKSLGLDSTKFEKDFDSSEVKERVNRNYREAISSGMTGTPTMLVNGKKIENPGSYDALSKIIQDTLDKSNETI